MKKIVLSLFAMLTILAGAQAQVIQVYKTEGGSTTLDATYKNTDAIKYKAILTKTPMVGSITISGASTLNAGESTTMTAAVSPEGASADVTWSISPTGQGVTIASDGTVTAESSATAGTYTITATANDGSGVTATYSLTVKSGDPNLCKGKFSVSATKQVQFTKGNLYWDGSAFKLEENQTDYLTSWDANHVSHFYWTNLTDYQSGNASYMPYAQSYSYSSQSTSDKFWCGEDNPLTVEGTSDLYTLTGGSSGEWDYLINSRTNASSLYKYGVTVTNNGTSYTNCLIIAPDDFTGTLQSSYTLDEVNNLGLVCLPAAGYRDGSSLYDGGGDGSYWSATPYERNEYDAYYLYFNSGDVDPASYGIRDDGCSVRLVK